MIAFLAALAMFTSPEGEHRWRYVIQGKDPVAITEQLSREMGYQRLCPNGWEILSRYQVKQGRRVYTFYEGKCK